MRHKLFRRTNQLPGVPADNCRAASAAFRRCSTCATKPFDKAKHYDSGSGTTISRRTRRSTAGSSEIAHIAKCFDH
jgi:hypothetical protein